VRWQQPKIRKVVAMTLIMLGLLLGLGGLVSIGLVALIQDHPSRKNSPGSARDDRGQEWASKASPRQKAA